MNIELSEADSTSYVVSWNLTDYNVTNVTCVCQDIVPADEVQCNETVVLPVEDGETNVTCNGIAGTVTNLL